MTTYKERAKAQIIKGLKADGVKGRIGVEFDWVYHGAVVEVTGDMGTRYYRYDSTSGQLTRTATKPKIYREQRIA